MRAISDLPRTGGSANRRFFQTDGGAALILLAPMVLLFLCAVVYPLIDTIRLSFSIFAALHRQNGWGFPTTQTCWRMLVFV